MNEEKDLELLSKAREYFETTAEAAVKSLKGDRDVQAKQYYAVRNCLDQLSAVKVESRKLKSTISFYVEGLRNLELLMAVSSGLTTADCNLRCVCRC